MSGMLRPQILTLLAGVLKAKGSIYAALYELNDPELINALVALGKNCNLILGNGAFKSNTAPNNDENAAVRAKLKTKVNVIDRIVPLGHFAHNKFVVFCDAAGKPQQVLTGSTNWTSSGLCTQANNGLIINDGSVAAGYLAAWSRLKAAGNGYPGALVTGNSTSTTYKVDGASVTPWFVRTSAAQDLEYARKLINGAQEGILFLFFNPGAFEQDPAKWTLLQNILECQNPNEKALYNANLYFRGVVNQEIAQLTQAASAGKSPTATAKAAATAPALDPTAPSPVTLFGSGPQTATKLGSEVMVPRAIKTKFDTWNAELLGASMVNIHSKVIVIDPFGEHPVVMTGSHNLGYKASSANDDNLCIIENNAPLAAAYAINIIAIYQNYRWNSYVEAHRNDPKVWHGLVDSDDWQASHLQGDQLNEINFWLKRKGTGRRSRAGLNSCADHGIACRASSRTRRNHTGAENRQNGCQKAGQKSRRRPRLSCIGLRNYFAAAGGGPSPFVTRCLKRHPCGVFTSSSSYIAAAAITGGRTPTFSSIR